MDPRLIERKKRLLQELSYILTELEEIYVAQGIAEKSDPVVSFDHPCQIKKETDKLDEEQTFEPEIEEFLACLAPPYSQDCKDQLFEYLQGMTEKVMKYDSTEEQEQHGMQDYIEDWFQSIFKPENDFLPFFLVPDSSTLLVSYIYSAAQVQISHVDMSLLSILLREWLLWKSAYT